MSKQGFSLLLNSSKWSCSVQVRGCSGTVRQPDAGCCRPQRKSPGMEGSRGVERALADNGQPASAGRPELKNKFSSCLSLVAEQTPRHFLLLQLLHLIYKQKVKLLEGFNICVTKSLRHCLLWFTAIWRNMASFLCILLSGNAQEKASDVERE